MSILQVQLSGEVHEIEYKMGESLLDCALRNNIDAPYSCQAGVCTSCLGKVKAGEVEFPDDTILSPDEVKAGQVLTCQARIKEGCSMVLIDYDSL